MIEIKNLNISYEKKILENVNFIAKNGQITLIKGQSGCGKTTLLYRIGLLSNQKNYEYIYNEIPVHLSDEKQVSNIRKNDLAFTLQDSQLIDFYTVQENLDFFSRLRNIEMNPFSIEEFFKKMNLNVNLQQKTSELSGGERQRLAIICSLIKNTDTIILDEPTSSLDYINEIRVIKVLQEFAHKMNKCIIITSHSSEAEKFSDKIYTIENKKLQCIKDNSIDLKKEELHYSKRQVNIKVFMKYVYTYIRIFYKNCLSILAILFLSFFIIGGIIIYTHFYQSKNIQEMQDLSANQLYVSLKDHNEYADEDSELFSENLLTPYFNDKTICYPYVFSSTTILDTSIDIIPYFPENNYKGMIEEEINKSDNNGVILSHSVSEFLKKNNLPQRRVKIEFKNSLDKESIIADVRYILKDGVKNYYTLDDMYILVPYQTLQNVYENQFKNQMFIGYTIFSDDFHQHQILLKKLTSNSLLDVNEQFQNSGVIQKSIDYSKKICISIIIMVVIMTLIITSYMFLSYFSKRKKEFVYIIISGFDKLDIAKLNIIEELFYVSLSYMSFVMSLIFIWLFIQLPLSIYLLMNSVILGEIVMVIFASYILNSFQIKDLSVEKELRD